ncbi:hypothetical protein Ddc_16978 [Ditylenchus destructor]|nr:hypothetical protein Ddc_16978 [Ditylenchus destructor]
MQMLVLPFCCTFLSVFRAVVSINFVENRRPYLRARCSRQVVTQGSILPVPTRTAETPAPDKCQAKMSKGIKMKIERAVPRLSILLEDQTWVQYDWTPDSQLSNEDNLAKLSYAQDKIAHQLKCISYTREEIDAAQTDWISLIQKIATKEERDAEDTKMDAQDSSLKITDILKQTDTLCSQLHAKIPAQLRPLRKNGFLLITGVTLAHSFGIFSYTKRSSTEDQPPFSGASKRRIVNTARRFLREREGRRCLFEETADESAAAFWRGRRLIVTVALFANRQLTNIQMTNYKVSQFILANYFP